MNNPSTFFALVKHLQQIRIASHREWRGSGWRRRYERLLERLGDVADQCNPRDLVLINGLVKDEVTQHYDIDMAYLQDFSLQFFDRYTSWIDNLDSANSDIEVTEDAEGLRSLKDHLLYKFAKKR